jgi:1,4-dihydroxy-2-naphthoate octaprenyltransferase
VIKYYLAEILDPTLLLGLLCSLIGVASAVQYGPASVLPASLVVIGSIFSQTAINLIDDYTDYESGLDRETIKTKFSGGRSKPVSTGKIKHVHALYMGIFIAIIAGLIGIYFALTVSTLLFALIAIGAITVLFYSRYIVKFPLLPEPIAMLGFTLIGIGSYIVVHGSTANLSTALFAIVPAGMLSGIALLVNEVPDAEIDKKYGRRHAVIIFDDERKVAAYYLILQFITYGIVVSGVFLAMLHPFAIVVLITLPYVFYVLLGILNYKNPQSYEKYMKYNVIAALVYMLIIIVSYSI